MTDNSDAAPAHPPALPATYTVRDVARLTQSSERHVWRLADKGLIPGRIEGLGRLVRFSRSAVDAWLACRSKPSGTAGQARIRRAVKPLLATVAVFTTLLVALGGLLQALHRLLEDWGRMMGR
jgi:excisionase family DNA binding protein